MSNSNGAQNDHQQADDDNDDILHFEESIKVIKHGYFGWGSFHPTWLQCCNHRWWLLLFIFLYGFFAEVLVSGFTASVVSSLEKRFILTSAEVGALPACSEVSAAIIGFIASYYAGLRHKGRFLSIGALVVGIGSIIFALPHFFVGPYQPIITTSNYTDLCIDKPDSFADQVCNINAGVPTSSRRFYPIFIISQLIMGAGYNLLWNIGYAYIDENVHPLSSAMYLAIMSSVTAIGPSLGFIIAATILQIYVDTPKSAPIGMTPFDPRWIGAWWICFLSMGIILVLISIPLFAFPKYLPGFEKYKALRKDMAGKNARIDHEYGIKTKNIFKAIKALVTNVPYMLIVAGNSFEYILVSGFGYFLVKIIETRFYMPAYQASLTTGYIALASGTAGIILSGIIMKFLKMNGVAAIKLTWIISIADAIVVLTYFVYCGDLPFAGVNRNYPDNPLSTPTTPNLMSSCNSNCMCNGVKYNPICGIDGVSFYSPCHAGCSSSAFNPEYYTNMYLDCSCVNKTTIPLRPYDALGGLCRKSCQELIPFLVGLTISLTIMSAKIVPITEAMMRQEFLFIVSESQRSFAVGFSWVFLRLVASLPAPILVGAFIDQACVFWDSNCSNKVSVCLVYDNKAIMYYISGISLFIKIASTICFFASWIFYKKDHSKPYEHDCSPEISSAKKDLGQTATSANFI
ncbi:uncharacterized protein TRIADDRAFT_18955 [Trichoplax adhaerens]|uniref:Solute carrier organic anion transporter family member n=1 Tax=Trichoplax adhaerens TaxID=10228 RepID=B3RLH8_TRIAD|nr:hypothetical protein TRIADDRAFT_18955 [Trichoplax adhaerens]EDV29540.1 hypothetical protein TRIADDRAFT_18955 [Trichoplax adhaerens]|eukprot:XP_002108742.1 hypothetical protein TRIADDRAFT_18955 [Trichoplax adhaerens]